MSLFCWEVLWRSVPRNNGQITPQESHSGKFNIYHLHVWSRVAVDLVHSEMTFTDLGKLRELSCQIPRARFAIVHVCPVSPWDPQRDPLSSGKWNRGQSTRSDTQLCCAANCELDGRNTKHGAPSPAQRWANRRRRWPIAVPALGHRPVFPDSEFNCHPPPPPPSRPT